MGRLIEELSKLSIEYRKRSDDLEFVGDCATESDLIKDGKSQIYWIVHNDLVNLIRKYNQQTI